MLGVVLWSDQEERKAVFWCEDHGDLAYYDGSDADLPGHVSFSAGDLVSFDVVTEDKTRRAHAAKLVEQSSFGGLSESLKTSAAKNARGARDSRVISLEGPARARRATKRAQNG